MNIKEAKEEISNTLRTYHEKDEYGDYRYPLVRQRPILLMGPPGIGKTAIMEQIAKENQVGLVAYTITHHTRQSAIGLPRIQEKTYEGRSVTVTEYTMSEIIDSVYDCMERTGKKEGILFIDEINCASETLAPTMLQFLQNKTFGSHKVPDGWMIVAAGNPPQYNKSVREFDIVTLDRVRRIDVKEDCSIWMEYARNASVHGAILSYLGMKKECFYLVENKPAGKFFVTARGWEDLSEMLKSYERLQIPVTAKQVIQFLQKEEIADNFAAYYQLYIKYGQDYALPELLNQTASQEIWNQKKVMAQAGGFEERVTVTELLLSYLDGELTKYRQTEERIAGLYEVLCRFKKTVQQKNLSDFIEELRRSLKIRMQSELLTQQECAKEKWILKKLDFYHLEIRKNHIQMPQECQGAVRQMFEQEKKERADLLKKTGILLTGAFRFLEECYGDGQEMILFMTELSRNEKAMQYIAAQGCDAFFRYSDRLLYQKQRESLLQACKEIETEVL